MPYSMRGRRGREREVAGPRGVRAAPAARAARAGQHTQGAHTGQEEERRRHPDGPSLRRAGLRGAQLVPRRGPDHLGLRRPAGARTARARRRPLSGLALLRRRLLRLGARPRAGPHRRRAPLQAPRTPHPAAVLRRRLGDREGERDPRQGIRPCLRRSIALPRARRGLLRRYAAGRSRHRPRCPARGPDDLQPHRRGLQSAARPPAGRWPDAARPRLEDHRQAHERHHRRRLGRPRTRRHRPHRTAAAHPHRGPRHRPPRARRRRLAHRRAARRDPRRHHLDRRRQQPADGPAARTPPRPHRPHPDPARRPRRDRHPALRGAAPRQRRRLPAPWSSSTARARPPPSSARPPSSASPTTAAPGSPWAPSPRTSRTVCGSPPNSLGEDLLEYLRATPATEYLVIEETGEIYGVLSTADVERAFVSAMARKAA